VPVGAAATGALRRVELILPAPRDVDGAADGLKGGIARDLGQRRGAHLAAVDGDADAAEDRDAESAAEPLRGAFARSDSPARGGSRRERFPRPIRLSERETVESAIPRHSALLSPVIRSLRSASIAFTRSAGVRLGKLAGREERS
jgi:NAD(P)-dependent dehydrogenase (short-subunit alcohol dehydrogenase family)